MGGAEFTSLTKTRFDVHEWNRVEILGFSLLGGSRKSFAILQTFPLLNVPA